MKATLEFNLPDEESEYRRAVDGSKAFMVLSDLDQWLRAKIKYCETTTEKEKVIYGLVRDELRDLTHGENLSFDL